MRENEKTKIIFFGSFDLAVSTLGELLVMDSIQIVGVVANPDTVEGRNRYNTVSPVAAFARENNLPLFQPESLRNNPDFVRQLTEIKPDLGVLVSYGKIIPQEILEIPHYGILNIHPSLLPKYRGPSPIQEAFLDNQSETGVSIIKLDKEMDHGPVLVQESVIIQREDDYHTLSKKLFERGTQLLVIILPAYISGELKLWEQDHDQATFTAMVKTTDAEIKESDTAQEALNKIRAFVVEPGAFANVVRTPDGLLIDKSGKRTKIYRAELIEKKDSQLPILELNKGYLLFQKVQSQGKKIVSGEEWFRGLR